MGCDSGTGMYMGVCDRCMDMGVCDRRCGSGSGMYMGVWDVALVVVVWDVVVVVVCIWACGLS